MLVSNAYTATLYRLCNHHYDAPPPGLGTVGECQDARWDGCEVCEATHAASQILSGPSAHVADRDRGQTVVRIRDAGGRVVVRYDRSDGELTVRPDRDYDDRWQPADRESLTAEARRALDGLTS